MESAVLPYSSSANTVGDFDADPALENCVLWQQWTNSQGLQKSCGEKGTAQPLSRGESTDPCLDRLLLLFWAHYIEDGPHLLCTGSL